MDIGILIQSGMGLLALLILLVIFLVVTSRAKEKSKKGVDKKSQNATPSKTNTDLAYLRSIIKKKDSTNQELKNALELIIKHHGTIHEKLGSRTHPDFDIYMDILFTICKHPNTSKEIILKFDKDLEEKNPTYKQEINSALSQGLNARKV
jgi:Na+-transporting methylmalonyl-CoA/oxaloacetate decarboxylase gamma subunit